MDRCEECQCEDPTVHVRTVGWVERVLCWVCAEELSERITREWLEFAIDVHVEGGLR